MHKRFNIFLSCCIIFLLQACSQKKQTNWHISLDKNSKDPFGCYIAYQQLSQIFPSASIQSGRNIMKEINETLNLSERTQSQRISIVVCQRFEPDSLQLDKIQRYIQLGNTVCIFAEHFSDNLLSLFHVINPDSQFETMHYANQIDSLNNQRIGIFFNHKAYEYQCHGFPKFQTFIIDTSFHDTYYYLGYHSTSDSPNVMISDVKDGTFIISKAPMALTNYFLLQDENKSYYEHFFSSLNKYPSKVIWQSAYYMNLNNDADSSISQLLKFPPLFFAFVLMMVLMLIYLLFESKRRQRPIIKLPANTNTSFEFIETVGRLYYHQHDHKNLSEKMIAHYLEDIRTKYGLKTNVLNDSFAELLSNKLDTDRQETQSFISYLNYIRNNNNMTEIDIKHLYHQLKKFI